MDPFLDRKSQTRYIPTKMQKCFFKTITNRGLIDAWRTSHPDTLEFSFFSPVHKSHSRIDYLFLTQPALQFLNNAEIGSILLSDHAPVILDMDYPSSPSVSRRWRFNNSLLLDSNFTEQFTLFAQEFFLHNLSSVSQFHYVWDAFKASARGFIINFMSRKKKQALSHSTSLLKQIKDLEHQYFSTNCPDTLSLLVKAKMQYNKLSWNSACNFLLKFNAKMYGGRNKAGRSLANYLKVKKQRSKVVAIKDDSGTLHYSDSQILDCFTKYYSSLYNPESSPSSALIDSFFHNIPKDPTSSPDLTSLDASISTNELIEALSQLPKDKTPGPDGFTARFYLHFKAFLVPHLKSLIDSFLLDGKSQGSFTQAMLCLIPKKDKDPSLCKNYRPISLINTDCKIYAKLLALRINKVIPDLINIYQSGFVKGRSITDNSRTFLNIIHLASKAVSPVAAITLDAEKAFDRVCWDFIFGALHWHGFSPPIIQLIRILYSAPTTSVWVNGSQSRYFPLLRGTRQGCPLSPLLFILALEPFLETIRRSPLYTGFQFQHLDIKFTAYADDILLFISNPSTSLPAFFSLLHDYSNVSGYKLNVDKSEILPLNKYCLPSLFKDSGFKWTSSHIKCLGILYCSNIKDLIKLNQSDILRKLSVLIDGWSPLFLSWWGRLATIKMMLLPIVNFYLSMLPVSLPITFFSLHIQPSDQVSLE